MRYVLLFAAFILCMPHGAAAEEQEKNPEHYDFNYIPIVCNDRATAEKQFLLHSELLRRRDSLWFQTSLKEFLALPSSCNLRDPSGKALRPLKWVDTVVKGRIVRSYFFVAFDISQRKKVYVIKDVLILKQRIAYYPAPAGFIFM